MAIAQAGTARAAELQGSQESVTVAQQADSNLSDADRRPAMAGGIFVEDRVIAKGIHDHINYISDAGIEIAKAGAAKAEAAAKDSVVVEAAKQFVELGVDVATKGSGGALEKAIKVALTPGVAHAPDAGATIVKPKAKAAQEVKPAKKKAKKSAKKKAKRDHKGSPRDIPFSPRLDGQNAAGERMGSVAGAC